MKHALTILLDFLLCALQVDLVAAEPGDVHWTRQSVEAELATFEPVLKQLGLKTPMNRARDVVA